MFAFALQAGGSLGDIVTGIPHDAGAAVVYIVMGAFVFLIFYGSRPSVIARYQSRAEVEPELEPTRELTRRTASRVSAADAPNLAESRAGVRRKKSSRSKSDGNLEP
jgi:hypothetical protein